MVIVSQVLDVLDYTKDKIKSMGTQGLSEVATMARAIIHEVGCKLAVLRPIGRVADHEYRRYAEWKRWAISTTEAHGRILALVKAEMTDRVNASKTETHGKRARLFRRIIAELRAWDLSDDPNVQAMIDEYDAMETRFENIGTPAEVSV